MVWCTWVDIVDRKATARPREKHKGIILRKHNTIGEPMSADEKNETRVATKLGGKDLQGDGCRE